jgi:hypothetical protein
MGASRLPLMLSVHAPQSVFKACAPDVVEDVVLPSGEWLMQLAMLFDVRHQ